MWPGGHLEEGSPTVSKIDITRDLGGCFFAKSDWKKLYKELQNALSGIFDTTFKDSGNSFDTNFQFVDQARSATHGVRIKYYWKNLAMMQSESVIKSLGMNYKSLFYPSVRMGLALRETQKEGLSRIEFTFTASTREAES